MLMNNLNSITLDTTKNQERRKINEKKTSFMNSIGENNEMEGNFSPL